MVMGVFVVQSSTPESTVVLPVAEHASRKVTVPWLYAYVTAGRHTPAAQIPVVHGVPHAPQLRRSDEVSASQPSAALWLQSAKGAVHVATAHAPAVQAAVPWAVLQAVPQPPQLATSVAVLASQPLAGLWSQSA